MLSDQRPPYLGAAYYPEMWPEENIPADIARMKEAGLNLMRVGEFAWGSMEPEEGKFTFGWLHKVVDALHAAGIAVVLCTPSATPPKWLTDKYPETLIMLDNGRRRQFGGRCHVCKSSGVMREKNRIIVEKMCAEFAGHPAVVGWQIDNEIFPYENGCFCPLCHKKFTAYLAEKYGTIERLNEAWGTARWSLAYRGFDDVIPPRSDTWNHPSLRIEWARFHSENISEYVDEQAAIVKRYFDVPVGTDMMPTLEQDYYRTNRKLDVVQFNHYDPADRLDRPSFWFDFMRPIKPRPFWNTETQTCWNGSECAMSGYRPRGNCYVNTWLPLLKGGEMNLYWLFKSHPNGHELAHGAVLTSAGRFYHTLPEIRQASEEFDRCRDFLERNELKSDIAVHLSHTAALTLKFAPLVHGLDYMACVRDRFHRPLRHYNVDLLDTAHPLDGYKVIVSPFLTCVDENGLKDRIVRWVEEGGTWIVGPLSDIMTGWGSKYTAAPYSFLEELAGMYTAFQMPVDNDVFKTRWKDGGEAGASLTFDGYRPAEGTESLIEYVGDHPDGLSAAVSRKVGKGTVIALGTVPSPADLKRLIPLSPLGLASDNVELIGRGDGLVAVELENKTGRVTLDGAYRSVLDGKTYSGEVELLPYTVLLLEKLR